MSKRPTPATSTAAPAAADSTPAVAYNPTADLQGLLNLLNELTPADKPELRGLIASKASHHAGQILNNWPKATA